MTYIKKDTNYCLQHVYENITSEYVAHEYHIATKIVETEYMLGIIEKEEFDKSMRYYLSFNLSHLKTILSKRLTDFAEAETHRDFNCVYE